MLNTLDLSLHRSKKLNNRKFRSKKKLQVRVIVINLLKPVIAFQMLMEKKKTLSAERVISFSSETLIVRGQYTGNFQVLKVRKCTSDFKVYR